MKTRCGSPSNWASERSGRLFIWQRTWLAKTYCLNPSFPCSYYIIILISCPNWNKRKHNLTPFLSFSPLLKEKYCVCVAVQLQLKACGLVKCRGLFPFLFAFCRLHFFSTRWMKQTHAASGRRNGGVLCTPDFIRAAVCSLTHAVVCRCVDLSHHGRKKHHRMIHSLAAAFLLSNCSGRVRILQYFVFLFFLWFFFGAEDWTRPCVWSLCNNQCQRGAAQTNTDRKLIKQPGWS